MHSDNHIITLFLKNAIKIIVSPDSECKYKQYFYYAKNYRDNLYV